MRHPCAWRSKRNVNGRSRSCIYNDSYFLYRLSFFRLADKEFEMSKMYDINKAVDSKRKEIIKRIDKEIKDKEAQGFVFND